MNTAGKVEEYFDLNKKVIKQSIFENKSGGIS